LLFEQFVCASKERVWAIGDVACWTDSSHTELQFLKGSVFVDVQISPDLGAGPSASADSDREEGRGPVAVAGTGISLRAAPVIYSDAVGSRFVLAETEPPRISPNPFVLRFSKDKQVLP
jgi:hypothetical protein